MNKHGISRRWFTDTDIKYLKSGALRTITNIGNKKYNLFGKLKKRIPLQVYIKDFVNRYKTAF